MPHWDKKILFSDNKLLEIIENCNQREDEYDVNDNEDLADVNIDNLYSNRM